MPQRKRVSRIATVCLAAAFLVGYQMANINSVSSQVTIALNDRSALQQSSIETSPLKLQAGITFIAATTALFFTGTAMGALMGGMLGDVLGRKRAVGINFLLFIVGGILETVQLPMGKAFTLNQVIITRGALLFYLGRIINGVGVGNATVTVIMYLLEMVPRPTMRGTYGTYFQFMITVGIVSPNLIAMAFKNTEGAINEYGQRIFVSGTWNSILSRLITGVPILLSIACFSLLQRLPESPLYCLLHDQSASNPIRAQPDSDLEQILVAIDRDFSVTPPPPDVPHPRISELMRSTNKPAEGEPDENTFMDIIMPSDHIDRDFKSECRRGLLSGLLLVILIQLGGINVLLTTANRQLTLSGFSEKESRALSMGLTFWNFLATIPAILAVERMGRVTLIRLGGLGCTLGAVLSFIAVNTSTGQTPNKWLVLGGLILFVGSFAVGIGSVMLLYINELLPSEIRSSASGIITSLNWTCSGIIVVLGTILPQALTYGIMISESLVCQYTTGCRPPGSSVLLAAYTFILPETRQNQFGTSPFRQH